MQNLTFSTILILKGNFNNYNIVRHIVFMGESTLDFMMNLFQLIKGY